MRYNCPQCHSNNIYFSTSTEEREVDKGECRECGYEGEAYEFEDINEEELDRYQAGEWNQGIIHTAPKPQPGPLYQCTTCGAYTTRPSYTQRWRSKTLQVICYRCETDELPF